MINSEIQILRKMYIDLQIAIDKITPLQKKILEDLQSKCNHPLIVETPYLPSESGLFSSLRPGRICEVCGYEEQGWGVGYKKLRGEGQEIREVDRNSFYSFRKPVQDISDFIPLNVPETVST